MPANNGALKDWPYRFEVVPVNRFVVDPDYQRPETKIAREVEADFRPTLIGTLIGSERKQEKPGKAKPIALIDGQQRWTGVTRGHHALVLPAMVYENLTQADEAQIFALLQKKRVNISTYHRFRAQLIAQEPESLAIRRIVQEAGFELDSKLKPDTIKAVGALEWAYKRTADPDDPDNVEKNSGELLTNIMNTLKLAYPNAPEGYDSGGIIRGLGLFLDRSESVDMTRLVRKLSAVTPAQLQMRASHLREGRGGSGNAAGYIADAIFNVYSK